MISSSSSSSSRLAVQTACPHCNGSAITCRDQRPGGAGEGALFLGIHNDLIAMPGLDRRDIRHALTQPAEFDLARTLERASVLVPWPIRVFAHWPDATRLSRNTPSQLAARISSRWSPLVSRS